MRALSKLFISTTLLAASIASADQEALSRMGTRDFFLGSSRTGCQAKGMKADSDSKYVWVAEMCGRSINGARVATTAIYNLDTRQQQKVIQTPAGSRKGILGNTEVEFTLSEDFALIARAEADKDTSVFPGFGMVTAVTTRNQKVSKYIPVNGAGSKIIARRPLVTSEGKKEIVYVANYFSDDISVLDVTNLRDNGNLDGREHYIGKTKLVTAFAPPGKRGYKIAPRGVAFTPDGRYAIILATETGSLIIMDAVRHNQLVEIAPIDRSSVGRDVNVRHIVLTKDGRTAYLSHMRGNAVSRIDVKKLMQISLSAAQAGQKVLPSSTWNEIFMPFPNGKRLLVLEDYPKDHPNFANRKWDLAHPNTIALDPVNNRYLYVSHRTTSNKNYNIIDTKIKGKIDIIDVNKGTVVMSLVGGSQPTALEVTPDNKMLLSAGFKDDTLYYYDLEKILKTYEN